jgi:hypothetical protein
MKSVRLVLPLLVLGFPLSTALGQEAPCSDSPTTSHGICSKKAGARCDPGSGRWVGGTSYVFDACMTAARDSTFKPDTRSNPANQASNTLESRYSDCLMRAQQTGATAAAIKAQCGTRPAENTGRPLGPERRNPFGSDRRSNTYR